MQPHRLALKLTDVRNQRNNKIRQHRTTWLVMAQLYNTLS